MRRVDAVQRVVHADRQLHRVVRPFDTQEHHARHGAGMTPRDRERQMRPIAAGQQHHLPRAQRLAQIVDVVGALLGGETGDVDARGCQAGETRRQSRFHRLDERHGIERTIERRGRAGRADRGRIRRAGAALIEGDHVGEGAKPVQHVAGHATEGPRGGIAGAAGEEHERWSGLRRRRGEAHVAERHGLAGGRGARFFGTAKLPRSAGIDSPPRDLERDGVHRRPGRLRPGGETASVLSAMAAPVSVHMRLIMISPRARASAAIRPGV